MSYDIYLTDPVSGDPLHAEDKHQMKGGTYVLGGTTELWLKVTWNYGKFYRRVMGDDGIRTIYGLTGLESTPILQNAIDTLGDDVDPDYWKATEGNAKRALMQLLVMAKIRPDGIWTGD